jgi:methylated-DNA-[protein]-cysteine S-methyltransferase
MKRGFLYETKIGKILIAEDDLGITDITLVKDKKVETEYGLELKETDRLREASVQLYEYLDGKRRTFTVPLHPEGTKFQLSVWEALKEIPYGETRSYRQIAERVGSPKAFRAVGMANHVNPIMVIIPCHRVIGADGSLVGFGGGLDIKKMLLDMEKGVN